MSLATSPSEVQAQLAHIHDDRSGQLIKSGAICLSVAITAVILRLISRRLSRARTMLLDDYILVSALVSLMLPDEKVDYALTLAAANVYGVVKIFEIVEIITQFLCVHYGEGKHAVLLKHPQTFGKLLMATSSMYVVAIATVKVSVLLFYRRIFPNPRFLIILQIVGGFIICYSAVQLLVFIFQCRPIRGAWDPFIKADCVKINDSFIVMGAFDVLTGVATLCLPIPLIWQLQVSRRSRIQLMSIFILGALFCIVSIYRLVKVSEQVSLGDFSYDNVDTQIWSVAEVCIAIICACLPTIRPLFDPRVRKHSIQKKAPKVNEKDRERTEAERIASTTITVRESISIEMEPYVSDKRENGQGSSDFLTLVRSDWQKVPYAKV